MFWVGRHTFGRRKRRRSGESPTSGCVIGYAPSSSKQWKGGTTMYRELLALGAKRDVARQVVCRGSDPKRSAPMPIVRGSELTLGRGDQSLCNGLKLGRPRMALPPDRFDFYPSFTHHFHSLFRMTSEPAWYRRISQADFISH